MPSETFFHLPEEKRQRLTDAALDEFSRVPFAETSINRIIQQADIPRGSFYQYFSDKRDLFVYLLRPVQQRFFALARQEGNTAGDLAVASLRIYDRFFSLESDDQSFPRCIPIIRCNPDTNFRSLLWGPKEPFIAGAATSARKETSYCDGVYRLFLSSVAAAVLETLADPSKQAEHRQQLQLHTQILAQGCGAQPPKDTMFAQAADLLSQKQYKTKNT